MFSSLSTVFFLLFGSTFDAQVMEASEVVQQRVKEASLVDSLSNQVSRVADVTRRSVHDITSALAQKAGFEQIAGNDDPRGFRDDSAIGDSHALWDREAIMPKSKSATAGWGSSSYQNDSTSNSNDSSAQPKGRRKPVEKVQEEDGDWGDWGNNDWGGSDKN